MYEASQIGLPVWIAYLSHVGTKLVGKCSHYCIFTQWRSWTDPLATPHCQVAVSQHTDVRALPREAACVSSTGLGGRQAKQKTSRGSFDRTTPRVQGMREKSCCQERGMSSVHTLLSHTRTWVHSHRNLFLGLVTKSRASVSVNISSRAEQEYY